MGSIGDCSDNAVAESFFGTLQFELLDEHRWTSRAHLADGIVEWIEGCGGTTRRGGTATARCSALTETVHVAEGSSPRIAERAVSLAKAAKEQGWNHETSWPPCSPRRSGPARPTAASIA
jgi:transposase InsO family protein